MLTLFDIDRDSNAYYHDPDLQQFKLSSVGLAKKTTDNGIKLIHKSDCLQLNKVIITHMLTVNTDGQI